MSPPEKRRQLNFEEKDLIELVRSSKNSEHGAGYDFLEEELISLADKEELKAVVSTNTGNDGPSIYEPPLYKLPMFKKIVREPINFNDFINVGGDDDLALYLTSISPGLSLFDGNKLCKIARPVIRLFGVTKLQPKSILLNTNETVDSRPCLSFSRGSTHQAHLSSISIPGIGGICSNSSVASVYKKGPSITSNAKVAAISKTYYQNQSSSAPPATYPKPIDAKICCTINSYKPYFYGIPSINLNRKYVAVDDGISGLIQKMSLYLNAQKYNQFLQDPGLKHIHSAIRNKKIVTSIDVIRWDLVRKNIYASSMDIPEKKPDDIVFKFNLQFVEFLPSVGRYARKMGWSVQVTDFIDGTSNAVTTTHTCKLKVIEDTSPIIPRFIRDSGVHVFRWIKIPLHTIKCRDRDQKETHSQIELDLTNHDELQVFMEFENPRNLNEKKYKPPPLTVVSFDCETRYQRDKPDLCVKPLQCLQIGFQVCQYEIAKNALTGQKVLGKYLFALGPCSPLPNINILNFYDHYAPFLPNTEQKILRMWEAKMLKTFRELMVKVDADVITGYNILSFDIPYIHERSKLLSMEFPEAGSARFWSRIIGAETKINKVTAKNRMLHYYGKYSPIVPGRILFDMFPVLRSLEPKSFSGKQRLEDVSVRYLDGLKKLRVFVDTINFMQDCDDQTRSDLAKYCSRDVQLALWLLLKKISIVSEGERNIFEQYVNWSRFNCLTLELLTGQTDLIQRFYSFITFGS